MTEHYLTEARFNSFEDKFDRFTEHHTEIAIKTEGRLVNLETNQSHAGWIATWLSGVIATIITTVILVWTKLNGR